MATIPAETWGLFDLVDHYRHGHLPEAGGVLDQPAWLMAAISHILAQTKASAGDG